MSVKRATEKQFQRSVLLYAKLHGWRTVHFTPGMVPAKGGGRRWVTPFSGDRGFPDTVFLRDGRLVFAELKVGANTVTEDQAEWVRLLGTVPGIGAFVWTPADWPEIERVLGGDIMTATAVEWVEAGRGFVRSACGRFDVIEGPGYWTAIDCDVPGVMRFAHRAGAVAWCENRRI